MHETWSKVIEVRNPNMTHRLVYTIFLPPCRVSTQWLGSSKWLARGGRRSRCAHLCAMHSQCLPKTVLQDCITVHFGNKFLRWSSSCIMNTINACKMRNKRQLSRMLNNFNWKIYILNYTIVRNLIRFNACLFEHLISIQITALYAKIYLLQYF